MSMETNDFKKNADSNERRYILRRKIMDFGMGFIYTAIAVVIFFSKELKLNNDFAESLWGKFFAGLILLYGIWRFFRAIKQDYLKER